VSPTLALGLRALENEAIRVHCELLQGVNHFLVYNVHFSGVGEEGTPLCDPVVESVVEVQKICTRLRLTVTSTIMNSVTIVLLAIVAMAASAPSFMCVVFVLGLYCGLNVPLIMFTMCWLIPHYTLGEDAIHDRSQQNVFFVCFSFVDVLASHENVIPCLCGCLCLC
jgi:hypothetical protein